MTPTGTSVYKKWMKKRTKVKDRAAHVMVFKFDGQKTGWSFLDACFRQLGCSTGWATIDGTTKAVFREKPDKAKAIALAKKMGGAFLPKVNIRVVSGPGSYEKFPLKEAIRWFRELDEATTSAMIGSRTTTGLPFYGRRGLATLERERQARMKRRKKCKGYDSKCRDKEWEVPAPVGGVALLRRQPLGSPPSS